MSDAAPKQSRFWGTTPRRIKGLFNLLFVLLALAIAGIILLLLRNFIWKIEATRFAETAGSFEASWYYGHGLPRLLEIAIVDDKVDAGPIPGLWEMKPAGRQSEGLDLYYYYISSFSVAPRAAEESYVRAFNHRMRLIYANPKWFDSRGQRLGPKEGDTNRPPFKVIPE